MSAGFTLPGLAVASEKPSSTWLLRKVIIIGRFSAIPGLLHKT
jgi:hypothetical protein